MSIPTPFICGVPLGFRVIWHSAFCIQRSANSPCRSCPGMNQQRLSNSFAPLNIIILKFWFVIKYRCCDGRLMLGRRSVPFSTSFRYFITIFYLVQRCKAVQQPLQIHPRSQCKQKLFCSQFEKSNFTFKPPLRILSVLFWRAFFYRSWTVGPLRSYNHVQVRFVLKVISASLSSFLNGAFIVL